jgi:uncharacterized membrane protein
VKPRRDWPAYASPGWLVFYAIDAAIYGLIYALLGLVGLLLLCAFGLWLIAIAVEGLRGYPRGDR